MTQESGDSDREARLAALKEELVGGLLLSPAEVGRILDVHQRTVLDYIHSGRLRAWQLGGGWKIPEQELRLFIALAKRGGSEPDKRSPFDDTRWQDENYEVLVDDVWYRPIAIDGVAYSSIIRFAKKHYADRWQKRVDEDLVELMKLLGTDPGPAVTLKVRPVDGGDEEILSGVAATREKRQQIWRRRSPRSPFDDTRWQDENYEVSVDGVWYRPIAIDGVSFDAIIAVAKERYPDRWQKRVDEDLVELMKLHGSEPGAEVTLTGRPIDGSDDETLTGVAATAEKRHRIWRRRNPKRGAA